MGGILGEFINQLANIFHKKKDDETQQDQQDQKSQQQQQSQQSGSNQPAQPPPKNPVYHAQEFTPPPQTQPQQPAQNPVAAFRDQLAAGVHKAYDIAQNAKDTTGAAVDQYNKQVAANKKTPFFNNTDNTPMQWLGKVAADAKKRGPFEAAQDLTYPILENPYIEPVTEPITGAVRMANYKAGRPIPLINAALGQTDADYGIKSPKSLFNYQGTDTPPTNPNNPPISQQSIDQIKNVKLPLINRPVNTQ